MAIAGGVPRAWREEGDVVGIDAGRVCLTGKEKFLFGECGMDFEGGIGDGAGRRFGAFAHGCGSGW
jgi:hypothetical protein